MLFILALFIFLLFILINLHLYKKTSWMENPFSQFGGPLHLPLAGHLFTPTRWFTKNVFNEMISDWFLKYPSPSAMYLILRAPTLLVYDPENFQILANKATEKGSDYKKFTEFYGNGIVTDNDPERRRKRRQLLQPSISLKVMGSHYLSENNRLSSNFAEELEVHADGGQEIDLWPIVQFNVCSHFLAAFMKFDENDRKDVDLRKFGRAVPIALKHLMNRIFMPWLYSDIGSCIGRWVSGSKKYFQDFQDFRDEIFEKLKARINIPGGSIEEIEELGEKKTFVETICSEKGSKLYTPEVLMEEVMSFFMGTTDLTAICISFTILMLAIHKDIQEEVFQEIQGVFGNEKREITMEDFDKLVYLERCIKETLRLFPSVPWISRRTTQEVKLKDNKILPSGCNVLLAIIGLHRNPSVYENPTAWIPDRFLPHEVAKRHPCSFVPFSTGVRQCLGYKNALLSMKSQISSLMKKYKFTTGMKLEDIDLNFDIHLRNDAGFRVRLQKRNQTSLDCSV